MSSREQASSPFHVPPFVDFLGWCVHRFRERWITLGCLETRLLAAELRTVSVKKPIYVAGLARSGSTLWHEIVASHPGVATHRIKDYPLVFTPYWWRRAIAGMPPTTPRERPHRDGMLNNSESPDSLEEMLWMAFFPRGHNPQVDNRLTAKTRYPRFEAFHAAHLRKLMLAENATRYVAKANYHLARLPYLARLYADATFIVPIRAPTEHVASLIRQHRWFSAGQRNNARSLDYMRRSGHFEFGRDRRPMNLGDADAVRSIENAWVRGNEVLGWARYWSMIHRYLARLLESNERVRRVAHVVRFEDLCASPASTIQTMLERCDLPAAKQVAARYAESVRVPRYYANPLTPDERNLIREETADAARTWGY